MKIVINGEAVEIPSGGGGGSGGVTMDQVNEAIDTKLDAYTPQEVYSTEETRIGTWIDGKPLYRKSFLFSNITIASKSSARIATIADLNIDQDVNIYGIYQTSKDTRIWKIGGQYTDIYISNGQNDNGVNGIFFYNFHGIEYKFNGVVTIEYTKTTDQATASVLSNTAVPKNNANFALNLPQQSVAFSPVTVSNITEEED